MTKMDPVTIRFVKTLHIEGFDCAHKDQTGHVSSVQPDGSFLLVLACGHVLHIDKDDLETYTDIGVDTLEALEDLYARNEGKMAKKGNISNVNGVVPVQGYSEQVKDLKFNHELLKRVTTTVDQAKKLFRQWAAEAAASASGDVTTIEFLTDDGTATVPVSIPDFTKDSNRVRITPDVYKEAIQLGFDIDDLDIVKTEPVVTLTGSWAAWFSSLLDAKYREKGADVANEHEITESTRTTLTVEGIKKLQKMAHEGATEQERRLAEMLLESGVKSPSVAVK